MCRKVIVFAIIAASSTAAMSPLFISRAEAAAIDTPLASVYLWLEKNRPELAQAALDKALLIDPTHAEALVLRVRLAYAAGQRSQAELALSVLAQTHPQSSALAQAQAYRRFSGGDGRDFATAEVMARTGRGEAAIAMAKRVFPKGPPGGELSLRYYRLMASVPAYWSVASDGLRDLVRQNPKQAHYRDALSAHLASPEGRRRAQAMAELERSQDPFVLARDAVLRDLSNGHLVQAEPALLTLHQQRKQDEAILAGLGRLRMGQGRHSEAVEWFSQALQANNAARRDELQSLKRTAIFWASLASAREQQSVDLRAAQAAVSQALALQPKQPDALNLQAQLFALQGQKARAEASWREALRHSSSHQGSLSSLVEWLANERRMSEVNVLLAQAPNHPELQAIVARISVSQRREDADALLSAGNVAAAEAILRAGLDEGSHDPWLAFDLAKVLQRQQRGQDADAVMAAFARSEAGASAYAYALFASSQNRLDDAEAALAGLPVAERSASIERYADELRLRRQLIILAESSSLDERHAAFVLAERMSVSDPEASADIAKSLLRQPQHDLPNGLAWLRARIEQIGADGTALAWQFALADVYVVAGDPMAAHAVLAPYAQSPQRLTNSQFDRFRGLQVDTYLGRGELAEREGEHAQAFTWFASALELEGQPVGDANTLSVEPEFAKTAAERALARNQQRLDGYVQSGVIYREKSGDDGLSSTRVTEIPTEIYWPLGYLGHVIGRVDQVSIDAGTLSSSLPEQVQFGQILAGAPTGIAPLSQAASGIALGIGFETDHYRVDVGTTPLGFATTSLVGGVLYSAANATTYQSLELSRRPVQSSLLSYAGTRDPVSGQVWGGVVRTGAAFRFSHSVGGQTRAIGGRAALLTGESVASNEELRLTLSQSHDVINQNDRQVNAGVALTYWHFTQDLSQFTFGHGGYYSPQHYVSVDFPLKWRGRWRDFAYLLEPSLGLSWASSSDTPYFPTDANLQAQAVANAANPALNANLPRPIYEGGASGIGFSYSLQGALEKQVAAHWFMGGGFRLDRAEFYSPNVLQLYLRYEIKPKRGRLEYPPRLIETYADF